MSRRGRGRRIHPMEWRQEKKQRGQAKKKQRQDVAIHTSLSQAP
jgi:hypothetical protein